jgi:hypothetical protein
VDFLDLKNRHAQSEVWIFGTGPSLDHWLQSSTWATARSLGVPVICLNHAIDLVESIGCRYWLANDNETWRARGGPPRRCVSLLPEGYLDIWDREAPAVANAVRAELGEDVIEAKFMATRELPRDRDQVARDRMLYSCQGTATPAAFLAWYMGAEWVHLVGVDGGKGHAAIAREHYNDQELQERAGTDYDILLSSCIRILKLLMPYHWTRHASTPEGHLSWRAS